MTNIIRRRETTPVRNEGIWTADPWQAMQDLLRWEPFSDTRLAGNQRSAAGRVFAPDFDVKESKDGFLFKADLPGVKEQDIEISLVGNQLRISGHRQQEHTEESDRYYTSECTYGSFSRTFVLPDGCDTEHIRADMKDGVLHLTVPKRPEVQPRRITLGQGTDKPKS